MHGQWLGAFPSAALLHLSSSVLPFRYELRLKAGALLTLAPLLELQGGYVNTVVWTWTPEVPAEVLTSTHPPGDV